MNNCLVKTIISGVMGSGLGLVFGVFMGAMDSAVRQCKYMHACMLWGWTPGLCCGHHLWHWNAGHGRRCCQT